MTVLSKPFSKASKKRALLIAILHVDRGDGSNFSDLSDLEFAHRDAEELRDLLIGMYHLSISVRSISSISASHGYQASDIVLMKDNREHPKHLWPTQQRIVCCFTFHMKSEF
ncbi:hypothetical protein J3R83DRAFT_4967 [Lanmaoa asiatica]|nr:hypothetical protein J3R83DRAFT_4967 [Lanmaoa asiatica]